MAAGGVTAAAGVIFVVNHQTHFFPTVTLVIAWLVIRSVILVAASLESRGSVRTWTALSAGMDLLLAVLLVAGLSITTIVISMFGPTPWLIASFAVVRRGELRRQRAASARGRRAARSEEAF